MMENKDLHSLYRMIEIHRGLADADIAFADVNGHFKKFVNYLRDYYSFIPIPAKNDEIATDIAYVGEMFKSETDEYYVVVHVHRGLIMMRRIECDISGCMRLGLALSVYTYGLKDMKYIGMFVDFALGTHYKEQIRLEIYERFLESTLHHIKSKRSNLNDDKKDTTEIPVSEAASDVIDDE